MDPRTSLIALALLRAQSGITGKGDIANRSTCNEPVQGSRAESHWEGGSCSWSHTHQCQGSVRRPQLSWPQALLMHTDVFRDTSPSLAHAQAVHCRSHCVSLASSCHSQRLGGTSAVPCVALLCTRLRWPKAREMDTGTSVQGSTSQCCIQVFSHGMLFPT